MDPSFSHKSSLESEKVEKNENLVAFLVGLVSGYANICSNGGLIILKLMLKLLMRPSNASLPNEIIELYILGRTNLFLTIINQIGRLINILSK